MVPGRSRKGGMTQSSDSLRLGFDAVPEIYDRIRPTYPSALFDELFALLPPEPRIVEVGPGTGQATADLLKRGAVVTAVEIGYDLASFLARKLGADDRLKVIRSSFEDAPLSLAAYDAVVSATAYHWVQPPARLEKPAAVLKPHGRLAVIDTNQVASPVDRGYFERVRPIYEKHGQAGEKRRQTADSRRCGARHIRRVGGVVPLRRCTALPLSVGSALH